MRITQKEICQVEELHSWDEKICKIWVNLKTWDGKATQPAVIEVPKTAHDKYGYSYRVTKCFLDGYRDPYKIKKIRIPAGCDLDAPSTDVQVWERNGIIEEYDTSQTSKNSQKDKGSVVTTPQPEPKIKKGFFANLFKK